MAGFYDDGNNALCLDCDSDCLTCVDNAIKCTTCRTSVGPSFRKNNSGVDFTCPCMPYYYDTGVEDCSLCDPSCLECAGPAINNCNKCNPSDFRILIDPTNKCDCKDGYYENGTKICGECDNSCLKCNGNKIYNILT